MRRGLAALAACGGLAAALATASAQPRTPFGWAPFPVIGEPLPPPAGTVGHVVWSSVPVTRRVPLRYEGAPCSPGPESKRALASICATRATAERLAAEIAADGRCATVRGTTVVELFRPGPCRRSGPGA